MKNDIITMRCTVENKKELEAAAEKKGMTLTDWLMHEGLQAARARRPENVDQPKNNNLSEIDRAYINTMPAAAPIAKAEKIELKDGKLTATVKTTPKPKKKSQSLRERVNGGKDFVCLLKGV